ncbi:MAG: winged helix-turn-helix domain-containing protein [Acidobacteriota bacterium]
MNRSAETPLPSPSSKVPPAPGRSRAAFGPFELDFHRLNLFRDGQPVPLQQLRVRALCLLVARAGEVVSREDFIEELWGTTLVEYDQSLPPIIRNLREVLGDSAQQPRYIQTVRGQGYRFLAAVEELPTEIPESRPSRFRPMLLVASLLLASTFAFVLTKASRPASTSILVMPFTAADPEHGELVAFSLSHDLKQRWRDSLVVSTVLLTEDDKGIPTTSQATYAIRGRITPSVVGQIIEAELLEIETGTIIATSSNQFVTNQMAPVAFFLNDDLVRPLVPPAHSRLGLDDGANLALQVDFELSRGSPVNHATALDLVRQALETDPENAQTLGLLAVVQFDRWLASLNDEAGDESARAARRALRRDPDQIASRVALASLTYYRERNPEETLAHLATLAGKADDSPRYWALIGALELARRNLPAARQAGLELADLVPFHPGLAADIDWILYASTDPAGALEQSEQSLALAHPYDGSRLVRALVFQSQERWDDLAEEANLFLKPRGIPAATQDAIVKAIRTEGRPDLFWRLIRRRFEAVHAQAPLYPELLAIAAAGAGEQQQTIDYLRQAWERRTCWMPAALQYPLFDQMRDHPDFVALQAEVTEALALDRPLPSRPRS